MSLTPSHLQEEALRLRLEERMSFAEISRATGVAKATLSGWLRPYPLTNEEVRAKIRAARRYATPLKSRGEESKHYRAINERNLLPQQKGKIAEVAVMFRLVLHGYEIYKSYFDGDKIDVIAEIPETGRLLKLQVRWVAVSQRPANGLPVIGLTCAEGHHKRRRYREAEFDFIIGYYLFNDTTYVYSWAEVANNKTAVSIAEEHAERWDKLRLMA